MKIFLSLVWGSGRSCLISKKWLYLNIHPRFSTPKQFSCNVKSNPVSYNEAIASPAPFRLYHPFGISVALSRPYPCCSLTRAALAQMPPAHKGKRRKREKTYRFTENLTYLTSIKLWFVIFGWSKSSLNGKHMSLKQTSLERRGRVPTPAELLIEGKNQYRSIVAFVRQIHVKSMYRYES